MAIQSVKQSVPESAGADSAGTDSAGDATQAPRATLRYVDRPDCNEIFADSISQLGFDGQTLRIEFAVSRADQTSENGQLARHLYPAARLVLTPRAAADLIQKLQQVAAALVQARIQKPAPSQPARKSNP